MRVLKKLVKDFGLQDRVHFWGKVFRDDIPSWLSHFDVFLFTSKGPEAMARTVMEAMAAGLVVIGSEVGGQKEILCNEVNSLTFQPEDAYGLAKQIQRVIQDPIIRMNLAQNGRQTILERFTLNRMVDEMETWWQDILAYPI